MAKKKKAVPIKLNAVWEITEAAMYIEQLDAEDKRIEPEDLIKIYRGNFTPLLYDKRIPAEQVWEVSIQIDYTENGVLNHDTMEWTFHDPMTFNELMQGCKRFMVKEAGITTIWQGISHTWRAYVNRDFKDRPDRKIISAWAVATCESIAKPVLSSHSYTYFASLLNKDFRKGHYLI